MKIGFVSDVHGNVAALSAAFDALKEADALFCLGDAISEHSFSDPVVAMLRDRDVTTIQGNHEARFFDTRIRKGMGEGDRDLMAWLEARPHGLFTEIGGKRLMLTHATPWQGWDYVGPDSPQFARFAEVDADILAYGHTHQPVARRGGGVFVINPGSTGEGRPTAEGFMPSCALFDVETCAATIIDLDPTGWR